MSFPSPDTLRTREQVVALIRSFFRDREVMEISTPIINFSTTNEVFLDSLSTTANGSAMYMHTSPEYAMKKYLSHYPVSIYQICKVFRDNEVGAKHKVEFSMLEWYRVGLDVRGFVAELVELLLELFPSYMVKELNYGEIFYKHFGFDPYSATLEELNNYILQKKILDTPLDYKSECLDLLFSLSVEPSLVGEVFYFVSEFPIEQASLASEKEITTSFSGKEGKEGKKEKIIVADRFELFASGMELANGYRELLDSEKLYARMKEDIIKRTEQGKPIAPLDTELVEAHKRGLPEMTGASLGLDRLLMLYLGLKNINEVVI